MAQFDRAIATALRLIQKNGQQVTWSQVIPGIPDPAKPWLPVGNTTINHSPFVCFLPLDRDGKEFLLSVGGAEAVSGAYYGLMGNVPFKPNLQDTITRDGVKLEIESIELLSPNGQKILYTIMFNG